MGVEFSKLCTGTFFAIANLRRTATISIRVDEDVLDYFKAGGAGYQSRMNAVLRHFVSEQKKKERA